MGKNGSTGPKYSKQQVIARRALVAECYLRGMTHWYIGQEVEKELKQSISKQMINKDLKAIRKEWKESAIRNFDEAKSKELAKLDAIEQEAWAAWNRSIGEHIKQTTETPRSQGQENQQGGKVTESREEFSGDPRYLQLVQTCIEKRCKILGLDAPEKREFSGSFAVESARSKLSGMLNRLSTRRREGDDPSDP